MDCTTAGPFVSMLCDGADVPDEAARHIAGCAGCQARLRDWAEAAARLRVLAAADRLAPLPLLALRAPGDADGVAAPPRRFWRAWVSPVRVLRVAVAMATVTLVIASVGWFRAQAGARVIRELHYEMTFGCPLGGGAVTSSSSGVTRVGARSWFLTPDDPCLPGRPGLLGVIEPVRVHDGVVTLRLGVSVADHMPSGDPGDASAEVREYESS